MRDNLGNILNHVECISEEVMLKYLEGKLNSSDQHRVEMHLLDCEFCSDALEGLSQPGRKPASESLNDLSEKIDNRINQRAEKIKGSSMLFRIAAILVVTALFLGGLYYLQSIKKSEKIFTENFEPFHDTVRPSPPPTVETFPAEEKGVFKEGKEKVIANNHPAQKPSANGTTALSAENLPRIQTDIASKAESKDLEQAPAPANTDAGTKKGDNTDDASSAATRNESPTVADESREKKNLDVKQAERSEAFSKKAPAPVVLREGVRKNQGTDKEKQLTVTAPSSAESPALSRDNTGSVSGELIKRGVAEYESKNYSAAISILQQVLNTQPDNAEALFYSGVSHLSLNEDNVAINLLESSLKNSPGRLSDAAKWYLSLAYVKKNKMAKAKKLLEDLSSGNSEYKSNAQKALDELK